MRHWTITARLAAFGLGMSLVAAMPNALAAGEAAVIANSAAVRIDNFSFTPPDPGRGTRHDGDLD